MVPLLQAFREILLRPPVLMSLTPYALLQTESEGRGDLRMVILPPHVDLISHCESCCLKELGNWSASQEVFITFARTMVANTVITIIGIINLQRNICIDNLLKCQELC